MIYSGFYKEIYIELFSDVIAAITLLNENNYQSALEVLKAAQQKTESLYLSITEK